MNHRYPQIFSLHYLISLFIANMPKLSRGDYESSYDLESDSEASADAIDSPHSGDESFLDNTSQIQGDEDPFAESEDEFPNNDNDDSAHECDQLFNESANDDTSPAPIKRARKAHTKNKGNTDDKPPGHSSYPITCWSITVSKTKSDVSVSLLSIFHNWITAFCLRGAAATEVGKRAFNFHLQSKIHCNQMFCFIYF
jgi:hypothetical protein